MFTYTNLKFPPTLLLKTTVNFIKRKRKEIYLVSCHNPKFYYIHQGIEYVNYSFSDHFYMMTLSKTGAVKYKGIIHDGMGTIFLL